MPKAANVSLHKASRLRHKADFSALRRAARYAQAGIRFVYRPNELEHARLGFAVSRKYGNAVQRNRLKRRVRAVFDKQIRHACQLDILIIPMATAKQEASFQDIEAALQALIKRG